jgi:hypothetical protein
MKKFYTLILATAIIFALGMCLSHSAFAQANAITGGPLAEDQLLEDPDPNTDALREDRSAVETWISLWYGPDGNYEVNGGFAASAPIDLIEEGTGGALNQVTLSTIDGLLMTQDIDVEWGDDHGGTRGWTVFELDPVDNNHMNRGGPIDNIDTYVITVIDSPEDMMSVMSPAHDDYAQIWINGEKWYNNSAWTGAAQQVDFNIEVELVKGANIVVYRCGESGGHAYMNLHFDDDTHNAADFYPDKAKDQASFFDEIAGVLAVDAVGKLTTTWADIKRND